MENIDIAIGLHLVCDWFGTINAELKSCNRNSRGQKSKKINTTCCSTENAYQTLQITTICVCCYF